MSPTEWQILIGILVGICSYFIGNIPNAVIISRIKGKDIRSCGSGNPGTMNMLRTYGIGLGVLTLALDVLKGVAPCLLGWFFMGEGETFAFGTERIGLYIAGVCVTLGHVYPVVMKFKGGKGAATILGVCATMQPIWTLVLFVLGVIFLVVAKVGSLTSFIMMSVSLTLEGLNAAASNAMTLAKCALIFALFALTLVAHRSNIVKLFSGRERQVVLFKPKHQKKVNYAGSAEFGGVTVEE